MINKKLLVVGVFFLGISLLPLRGEYTLMKINLRFFEAVKTAETGVSQAVTSSYLHPTVQASLESNFELEEVRNQINKVFNLGGVSLLTEAGLIWNSKTSAQISHTLRLDSKEYLVLITPSKGDQFRLEVYEQSGAQTTSLLDTRIILPYKNVAVFGFEDKLGKPYFLSFNVADRLITDVLSPKIEEVFAGGPIRVTGDIKPPKFLKMVEPVYPEVARFMGAQGIVILETTTDETGHVVNVKILRSIPLLDQVAMDAARQWVFEPLVIDDKPKSALFTVTVAFRLDREKKTTVTVGAEGGITGGVEGGVEGGVVGGVMGGVVGGVISEQEQEEFAKGAVRAVGEIKPPKLIKEVEPVYPEAARKSGIEGVVILEVKTDEDGNVVDAKTLRSIPALDQAAIAAVKQWKYEPLVIKGNPVGVLFTITVRFQLKGEEQKKSEEVGTSTGAINLKDLEYFAKGAVMVGDQIKPPRLLTSVSPVYPENARVSRIEGVVILAARTDEKGQVIDVKILTSIPSLDKAAIDAVRQWKYEPLLINGKPTPVVFTVTVRFQLK
jgi:TonB family protein